MFIAKFGLSEEMVIYSLKLSYEREERERREKGEREEGERKERERREKGEKHQTS